MRLLNKLKDLIYKTKGGWTDEEWEVEWNRRCALAEKIAEEQAANDRESKDG